MSHDFRTTTGAMEELSKQCCADNSSNSFWEGDVIRIFPAADHIYRSRLIVVSVLGSVRGAKYSAR